MTAVLPINNIMENDINQPNEINENSNPSEYKDDLASLTQKVNVDQQAIDEARDAVGDDEDKIREYLINNRGL